MRGHIWIKKKWGYFVREDPHGKEEHGPEGLKRGQGGWHHITAQFIYSENLLDGIWNVTKKPALGVLDLWKIHQYPGLNKSSVSPECVRSGLLHTGCRICSSRQHWPGVVAACLSRVPTLIRTPCLLMWTLPRFICLQIYIVICTPPSITTTGKQCREPWPFFFLIVLRPFKIDFPNILLFSTGITYVGSIVRRCSDVAEQKRISCV